MDISLDMRKHTLGVYQCTLMSMKIGCDKYIAALLFHHVDTFES